MEDTNTPLDPMADQMKSEDAVEETPVVSAPVADDDAELDAEVAEGDEADEAEAPAEAGEEVKSNQEVA